MDWRLKHILETYKHGMVVQFDADMNDDSPHAPKKGMIGRIISIDSMGTLHTSWENGSSLGLIVGEDSFHVVKE